MKPPLSTQHPYSALIVDDQEGMREVLRRILRFLGYGVAGVAADGLQAVQLARTLKPDFILMDISMPVMDGVTAARHILAEQWVPIIICSGLHGADIDRQSAGLEIVAVLGKPVTVEELKAAIAASLRETQRRALESHSSRSQMPAPLSTAV